MSWVAKFIHFKHWAQKFDEVNTHLSRLYYLEKIIDFFHITKNYPVNNWGVFAATVLYQSDDDDDEITRCNAWSPLVWSPFFLLFGSQSSVRVERSPFLTVAPSESSTQTMTDILYITAHDTQHQYYLNYYLLIKLHYILSCHCRLNQSTETGQQINHQFYLNFLDMIY